GQVVVDPGETLLRAGVNLREFELDFVNRFNDRLYFATKSGMIVCIRESAQVAPRPLKDPSARPFGYVPPDGIPVTPPPAPSAEPRLDAGAQAGEPAPSADKTKDKPESDQEKDPEKEKKEPEAEKDEPK